MKGKNFMSNINLSEISSLIKKQIEDMKQGNFTEEELENTKQRRSHLSWIR